MNGGKIIALVLQELASEYLKTELELERIINSDMETNIKLGYIKSLLFELTKIENSINKFNSMLPTDEKTQKIDE